MDIPVRCPHCATKLLVEDDLVGQSVLCEDCETPFTVNAPSMAPSPKERPRRPRADDGGDIVYEFDDGRPIRRKPRARPNALAPMIFGGALVFAVLLIAVGLFFAFGFDGTGGTSGELPGAKFRLANARRIPDRGFSVEVEATDGKPAVGGYRIVWRSTDKRNADFTTLVMAGPRHVAIVSMPLPPKQSYEIWIEPEPSVHGTKVSNVATLRSD